MPRELVTKGSRFYCVSTTPDICKTPVGSGTPPIPYMIKGEFSQATGVSKDIRSNGEPVVISDSTVIPAVTGDEAGTAKGIKSGTVGKRVQHDQKSSTVSFNGERTIREGDTVFMNDKNTRGKVLQRGGGGSANQSSGDRFDAAMARAAGAIEDATGAAAGQLAGIGETEAGGRGLDMLDEAVEMGEIKVLGDLAERMKTGMMDAAVKSNNRAAGMAAAVGIAAVEIFMPTNILDFTPGAGKLLKFASKAVKKVRKSAKAKRLASAGGSAGHVPPTINVTPKAGSMSKAGDTAPPAKGNDGGKSRGKGKKDKKDKPSDCCPRNAAPAGKRTRSKHPVHFGTGEEILRQTDFAVGGAIPIVWTRCYRSGSETEDWNILGARWASPFTSHVTVSRKGIVYHDDTGRALRLPAIEPGASFDHRGEGFVLARQDARHFTLTWRDGSRDLFRLADMGWLPHGYQGVNAMLPAQQPELCERCFLYRSEDAAGRGLCIERFDAPAEALLLRIVTDDGRVVEAMRKPRTKGVETDLVSHVEEVRPDGERIRHVEYEYAGDASGPSLPALRYDLVSQTDRGGARRHYRYTAHLLTAYTTYGGFEHRLEWISLGALRARWSGSTLTDRALAEASPITVDNSYQARATATRTADGRDEVTIAYIDEDTTRVTEPSGTVFEYTFDENWLAVDVALVPAGGGRPQSLGRRSWDADGMLLDEADALFNTSRYSYDSAGNLVANTNAEGHTTLLDYDAQNRPVKITDALGNATSYQYDDQGNLAAVTNALGHTTRFEYDQLGRTVAQIDAKGNRTLFGYDSAGRLANQTDCSGFRSYYRYDADDRLVATLDALEQETSYTYDAWDQVTAITYPDGTQDHYAYDAEGNAIRHTDALGHQTHYRYDGQGMPVEQINALGHSVHYRYDAALRLVELINGNGESYRFSYTPEGWLASETTYEGKITEYRYDRAGQLIAYACCGVEITLERDRMGRLLLKTTPDGLTRYQYDALGRLHAVTAPHAENGFVYDAVGQLLEEHSAYFISEPRPEAYRLRRVPDHYFVMRYAYDELGNRIQTVLPDGHRIDVLRYGSGHWHGVLWDGEPVVDIERDRLHRERRRQIGPKSMNLVATRSYDVMSRIATMDLKRETRDPAVLPLRERKFVYDALGNLLTVAHGWHSPNQTLGLYTYEYDSIGQLLEASQPGLHEFFRYDACGNIISSSDCEKHPAHLAGLGLSIEGKTICYTFDSRGNTVSKCIQSPNQVATETTYQFGFDNENHLIRSTRISKTSLVALFYYDALGRRIAKRTHDVPIKKNTNTWTTNLYIWDNDSQIIEQQETSKKYSIFTPNNEAIAAVNTDTSDSIEYFNVDHRGIPLETIDECGELSWEGLFKAWGRLRGVESDPAKQPRRFPGQVEDAETGLFYNQHRYYDPDNGSFLTEDPLGLSSGLNLYAYAPNPTGWLDPSGLTKCKVAPTTAADEISGLPPLYNQRPSDIRKILRRRGYNMVGSNTNKTGANTGGQVWTKSMADGNTAAVRIDPPEFPTPAKNADQVPHAHKEIVPSDSVSNGNYGPPKIAGTILCNDRGVPTPSNQFRDVHIEIRQGRLITRPPKPPKT